MDRFILNCLFVKHICSDSRGSTESPTEQANMLRIYHIWFHFNQETVTNVFEKVSQRNNGKQTSFVIIFYYCHIHISDSMLRYKISFSKIL